VKQRFLLLESNVDCAVVSVREAFQLQLLIYHSLFKAEVNDTEVYFERGILNGYGLNRQD
jgi:hypothetical protein